MQRNFQGKTVVITGACRGIGAGIAERFARDGANLVMVSNAERVHETAEQLRQCYQADILSLEVDVTDEAQVQALYEQAAARLAASMFPFRMQALSPSIILIECRLLISKKCWR